MGFAEHCKLTQSPHQIVSKFYGDIALIQLEGYIIKLFGYAIFKLFNEGNFTVETEEFRQKHEANSKEQIKLLKEILQSVSRVIWKCDPDDHFPGRTYLEVTELLQGYLQTEGDLTSIDTCTDTCGTLRRETRSFGCQEKLCRHQRKCKGIVRDCEGYNGRQLAVCLALDDDRKRYHAIRNENFKYGKQCPSRDNVLHVEDWWRGFVTCDYCFCLCDEEGEHSDRYFNLRPVMADLKNKRVVTGLRFVKYNRIIHLQIQEGKLLPGGSIDNSTVRWVPVEDYNLYDQNIKEGRDYYALSYESRFVLLDDVLAKKGEVLIGLRLTVPSNYVQPSIAASAFNISTGIITSTAKHLQWISSNSKNRDTLLPTKQDVSYYTRSFSMPTSTKPSYIWFTHTDWFKDAAQSTVPTLDAQPVTSAQPLPLEGIDLYHKGENGYGGFVAPKIISYDFGHHL